MCFLCGSPENIPTESAIATYIVAFSPVLGYAVRKFLLRLKTTAKRFLKL